MCKHREIDSEHREIDSEQKEWRMRVTKKLVGKVEGGKGKRKNRLIKGKMKKTICITTNNLINK